MAGFFVNLPLRYIEQDPRYLQAYLDFSLQPELGLDAFVLDSWSMERHAELAQVFHRQGLHLAIHLPFFDLQPGSIDQRIRSVTLERLSEALRVARVYKPKHLVGHLGYDPILYRIGWKQWQERALITWRAVAETWPDHPPIFLENVKELDPGFLGHIFAELAPVNIRWCFDLGHWFSFGQGCQRKNLTSWLNSVGEFLGHVHLHDNSGIEDQHCGLGRGIIPWGQVFSEFEARGLKPTATLEPHQEEDLWASLDFIQKRPSWFDPLGINLTGVLQKKLGLFSKGTEHGQ